MLAILGGSFIISLIACALLVRFGRHGIMLDRPNARSLHAVPTPRTGGIAIALGMAPVAAIAFGGADLQLRTILAGWLLVFAVSLLDDFRSLPAWSRLAVHLLAGLLVVLSPGFPQGPLSMALGVLWIAWGTNLFNFMDGMDGLAGSMALLGGIAMSIAIAASGGLLAALLLAAAAAAVAGFLVFNLPPARIFMGDAGSAPLGFLFSAIAVNNVSSGSLPAWVPLLVFLPFIADTTFTVLRRMLAREPFWKAHRSHAYQRLVLSGWTVRRTLVVEIIVMLACGGAALGVFRDEYPGWQVLATGILLSAFAYWVIMSEHRVKGN